MQSFLTVTSLRWALIGANLLLIAGVGYSAFQLFTGRFDTLRDGKESVGELLDVSKVKVTDIRPAAGAQSQEVQKMINDMIRKPPPPAPVQASQPPAARTTTPGPLNGWKLINVAKIGNAASAYVREEDGSGDAASATSAAGKSRTPARPSTAAASSAARRNAGRAAGSRAGKGRPTTTTRALTLYEGREEELPDKTKIFIVKIEFEPIRLTYRFENNEYTLERAKDEEPFKEIDGVVTVIAREPNSDDRGTDAAADRIAQAEQARAQADAAAAAAAAAKVSDDERAALEKAKRMAEEKGNAEEAKKIEEIQKNMEKGQ